MPVFGDVSGCLLRSAVQKTFRLPIKRQPEKQKNVAR